LPVEISPLPDNKTSLLTPAVVSFKATDEVAKIYYQITSMHGNSDWFNATLTDNKSGQVIITQSREAPLARGTYFLRAFATDKIMETTLSNATGINSPFIGEISSYFFHVIPSPIALDNRGDSHLTAIDEDIVPTTNQGTLISELIQNTDGTPIVRMVIMMRFLALPLLRWIIPTAVGNIPLMMAQLGRLLVILQKRRLVCYLMRLIIAFAFYRL